MRFLALILLLGLLVAAAADPQLVFAIDVVRHGDRTPLSQGGQLTAQGMQQMRTLGQNLRFIYVDSEHLLPPLYSADTLYVRSSHFNRTIMSARSLLSGLYPGEQAIPIYTAAPAQDKLFFPLSEAARMTLLQKYVFSDPTWQNENTRLQVHYASWNQATGFEVTNLYQVIPLGDVLRTCQAHGLPLPQTLSQNDVDTITHTEEWAIAALFKPKAVGMALSSNLLLAIIHAINRAANQEKSLKYMLFSGHDTTILSLLSALGVPQDSEIPYASDLRFELFRNQSEQYLVKISLNDQILRLPNCHDRESCTLTELNTIGPSIGNHDDVTQ